MRRAAADDLSGDGDFLESNGHVARLAHQRHRARPAPDDRRARVHADPRPQLQPVAAAELAGERLHLLEDRHGRVRRAPGSVLVSDRVSEAEQEPVLVALHHGPVEAARRAVARLAESPGAPRLVLGIEALEVGLGFEDLAAADENGDLAALGLGGAGAAEDGVGVGRIAMADDAPLAGRRQPRTARRSRPPGSDACSSATTISWAVWKRCCGVFSMQRRTIRSRAGEMLRPDAERSAGASFRIAAMVSAGVSFLNAFRPDSSS